MSKRGVVIISTVVGVIALGFGACFLLDNLSSNRVAVEERESLIAKQSRLESKFGVDGFTLDQPNVILDPYDNSPLSALVIFKTDETVSSRVTIVGKDDLTTFSHTFEPSKEHYLPIYGLYADSENHVLIEAGGHKKDLTIKTGALPKDIAQATEVVADKDKLTNDLYFFTPASLGPTAAYDVNGDVRWYLSERALWKIDRLRNGRLLLSTERLVNPPYYSSGLYEMDLLGKIYTEYSLPGGYHHDYFEMPSGNLLVASDDFDNEAGTVEDVIVELNRQTGNVVKTFDLKNILNMKDGKSEDWTDYDWFHNNSVWYDEDTNSITLSGRHQDAVINIDYGTGKLNWIIGDSTNWSEEYQKYFFKPVSDGDFEWQWSQHAAMITPEGYVFILDNGNNKSKVKENYVPAKQSYTRGVMYKIDTENMTIEQVWQYGKQRGSEFYSPYISDVDYLGEDHYIVHSGGISYKDGEVSNAPAGLVGANELVSDTVELLNNQAVFEIKLPTNNYRVEKMGLYVDQDQQVFTEPGRLGSLGKTVSSRSQYGFIALGKNPDDVYKKHEIKLAKESDRLEIKGRFKRGDEVKVMLYQKLKTNVYDMRVSKKPYTALCVDILTDEENENGFVVTKYINKEGLEGKYSIYLEINNKLYNTEEYVEF